MALPVALQNLSIPVIGSPLFIASGPALVICCVTEVPAATAGRTRDELMARAPTKPRTARWNREGNFMTLRSFSEPLR